MCVQYYAIKINYLMQILLQKVFLLNHYEERSMMMMSPWLSF